MRLPGHALPIVVGALVLAGALAACAGGDEGTSPPSASATTADQSRRPSTGTPSPSATSTATAAATASATATAAAPDPSAAGAGDIFDRKVIVDASVELKVADVAQAFEAVTRIADSTGGMVFESTFYTEKEYRVGRATMKVPNDRFGEAMSAVRGLALEVIDESSSARDVTAEYTDLNADLTNLKAVEAQYLQLLTQAKEIKDILTVQDRLNNVRGDIERTQGRLNLLTHLTDLATIKIEMRPEAAFLAAEATPVPTPAPAGDESVADRLSSAFDRSLDMLTAVAAVLVFLWWVAPLAIAGVAVRWWALRRRRIVDTAQGRP